MGTTSQKLSYLNDTKGKLKDSINKFRDGITNQTTFRDYATELDVIYDKLPKVDNTSDASQLLNAQNGLLDDFKMYGNTQQNSYTGKNLFKPFDFTRTTQAITFTYSEDGSININGTSTGNAFSMVSGEASSYLITLVAGTYAISGTIENVQIEVVNSSGQAIGTTGASTYGTFTISSTTQVFIRANLGSGLTFNNVKVYPQLELGSTPTDYEPYVGEVPSPNPDYPQNINVVSGNQTVNVSGKNKYGITSATGYTYSNSIPSVSSNNMVIDSYDLSNITFHTAGNQYLLALLPIFTLEPNTNYIINYTRTNNLIANVTPRRWIYAIDSSNNYSLIQQYFEDDGLQSYQFTTGTTGKIAIAFGFSNNSSGSSSTINNLMIRLATESDSSFEPYYAPQNYTIGLGSVELCKIGDNQDYIYKTSGKNLFDGLTTKGSYNTTTGEVDTIIYDMWRNTNAIKVEPNKDYIFSLSGIASNISIRVFYYDINKTFISSEVTLNGKIITPHNCYYLNWHSTALYTNYPDGLINAMIEQNTTATVYEPYGKGDWYKKSYIGKVVLNGSENWSSIGTATSGKSQWQLYISNLKQVSSTSELGKIICDKYTTIPAGGGVGTYNNIQGISVNANSYQIRIYDYTYNTSLDNYETWLSTHNTTVYYVLATTTDTQITDETLISQLESIKVNTGSNYFTLSNSNNVLPNIYAKRLKKLDSLT